jgi:hypothetical protein
MTVNIAAQTGLVLVQQWYIPRQEKITSGEKSRLF